MKMIERKHFQNFFDHFLKFAPHNSLFKNDEKGGGGTMLANLPEQGQTAQSWIKTFFSMRPAHESESNLCDS